ncbi:MAG: hypothetical protein UY26_C0003G0064 [Candidatus Jorgensenbacteria bacterium GW2011_GWA1_48_13]|uniref:Uncharacterized protein n=1 Tax=Candidatus Jorgensenbacteria bacterium GW2011_GWB1_50_10 TaxID=1618665 RepID=A0A0G1W8R0_9BACT|nr:MAG: hypothetical protein UY26_C0003G0064 [Candidatus Jorgensenbacteria bacterium GW2011_GWA1_48_13]KKW15025.1 MAG: hypothetical protein UY55_C0002G0081 [Candidatus Jorgensenbacteria bacterium GW2011_GWB1_50_10]
MTTRRIYKKDWLRSFDRGIEVVERVSGRKVLNKKLAREVADDFLRGKVVEVPEAQVFADFTMMPLTMQGVPDSSLQIAFGRWPLELTIRSNTGALDIRALEREYESRRSSHSHIRVRFREIGYAELKREFVSRLKKEPPIVGLDDS